MTSIQQASRTSTRRLIWLLPLGTYAFFFWRSVYGLGRPILHILDWVIVAVGLGAWCLVRYFRHQAWPRTHLDLILLAWCGMMVWATIFSVNLRASLRGLWEAWTAALILWLLVDLIRHRWAPTLWRLLYLLGSVVCLIGAAEFLSWYFGSSLLGAFQQGWFPIGGLVDPIPPNLHRLSLALANATAVSAFIAALIPPAICIAVGTPNREVRFGMLLWLSLALLIELLSLSRGGFLALGVSLLFLLVGSLFSPQVRSWQLQLSRWKALLLFTLFIVGALVVRAAAALWLLSGRTLYGSGDAVRIDYWRSAIAIIQDHSLTGVGPAAFGTALRLYRDPFLSLDYITTAHNVYLNVAAEMGLPGFLVGVALIFFLVRAWWRRWRSEVCGSSTWWRLLGIGAALAGLATQSLVDTFAESAIVLLTLFFVAYILASGPSPPAATPRARRWPWMAALAILAFGAIAMAWDSVGFVHYSRSLNFTRRGQIDAALSAGELARAHDPWMPLYACHVGYLHGLQVAQANQKPLTSAVESYGDCTSRLSAPGWVDQLNQAALLWQAGQAAAARIAVEEAVARTPVEWKLWLSRGYWAETLGEREVAIQSYAWVLTRDPRLAGSPFWSQGERSAAWHDIVAAGEQLLVDRGSEPASWRWQVYIAAEQWEVAVHDIQLWLHAHPNDTGAMAWLAEALLGQGRPTEALSWLAPALTANPRRARSYLVRGEAEMALGQHNQAEQSLRKALFLNPNQLRVHAALAKLALLRGDVAEAQQQYRQAVRLPTATHNYDLVLYDRLAWPVPLPQVMSIGYAYDRELALEWGALLEEWDDDIAARALYETTLALDPLFHEVQDRLDKLH